MMFDSVPNGAARGHGPVVETNMKQMACWTLVAAKCVTLNHYE